MRSGEFFIDQVKDLVIINLKVAALDNKNATFRNLTFLNLLKQLLKPMYQDALILQLFYHGRSAPLVSCRRATLYLWTEAKKASFTGVDLTESHQIIFFFSIFNEVTKFWSWNFGYRTPTIAIIWTVLSVQC